MHPISWQVLCRPKRNGGLGIRRAAGVNKALLSKLIWRLHTEVDRPWVSLMQEKYKMEALQDLEARVDLSASFIWRAICWSKDLFLKGMGKLVRNGQSNLDG